MTSIYRMELLEYVDTGTGSQTCMVSTREDLTMEDDPDSRRVFISVANRARRWIPYEQIKWAEEPLPPAEELPAAAPTTEPKRRGRPPKAAA